MGATSSRGTAGTCHLEHRLVAALDDLSVLDIEKPPEGIVGEVEKSGLVDTLCVWQDTAIRKKFQLGQISCTLAGL